MSDAPRPRPPYLWAAVLFFVVFALYVVTLSPTTALWDAPEYITAAKVLGIPHPPGNPLFTLLAHVWGLMPFATDYAKRINLFAAFTSAASAAIWFLVAERWLQKLLADRALRLAAAFAGIFASATAWTVWNQSTANEKVYTVSMLSIALVAWLSVRWADEPVGAHRDRFLLAAIYILALSSTNHTMGLLGAPVLLIYLLATDWRVLIRPRVVACAVVAIVIGVSLNYLYLPLRAAQLPALNEGEATGFFSHRLMDVLNRVQYAKPGLLPRLPIIPGAPADNIAHFGAQLSMYAHYWTWQWGRDFGGIARITALLFAALGIGGLVTLIRRDRRAGLAAAALAGTLTLLLIFYLNFRYSYGYHAGDPAITNDMREVRERDYFFVASFAFAGVLIAAGFAALLRLAETRLTFTSLRLRQLALVPIVAIALIPVIGNRQSAPRTGETLARDYASDMLQSVEPYGILITAGDNDTFPLWYAQEVMGIRRDVTLANLSLMGTDWHLRQLRRRQTPPFDMAHAAELWRSRADSAHADSFAARPLAPPTSPVFSETLADLDSLPDYAQVPAGSGISAGKFNIRFNGTVVSRSMLAAALLIRDNIGKRPIFFSVTDGPVPDEMLGLGAHLVTQGMVRKVVADSVVANGEIVDSEYFGMVDVARTSALLFGTYHVAMATRDRPGGWYDGPSADMLGIYLRLYAGYAPVLQQRGDTARAAQSMAIAEQVRRAIDGK